MPAKNGPTVETEPEAVEYVRVWELYTPYTREHASTNYATLDQALAAARAYLTDPSTEPWRHAEIRPNEMRRTQYEENRARRGD